MRDLSHLVFARPIPVFPDSLEDKLNTLAMLTDREISAELSEEERDLYTRACGVAPGFPEAFASATARDAALGPFGRYVEFVEASWTEAEAGGFPIWSVAIGHALGDEGFADVARPVLDAVANRLQENGDLHDIIIARTRYVTAQGTDGIARVCGWQREFDGPVIETAIGMETLAYLNRELSQRLGTVTH